MDVVDAIRTLLAVRDYQDRPVPEATVRGIIEAARLTGSAMNAQPWHFVVVQERETLRELGRLARSGPYVAQAPLAVVVAVEKKSRFALSDASRAIQAMMLAAWADGVGSNWVGFSGMDDVGTLLKVPPSLDVVGIVPFGYPTKHIGRGQKRRKPLREIAHRERYAQPFE
jgi:nitroreductase